MVDTAGAGDWTAAALINELFKEDKADFRFLYSGDRQSFE